jgi:hypothetical protein
MGGKGATHLLGNQFGHLRVAVSKGVDGNASGEIEIFPILNIPQVRALALDKYGRRAQVCGYHKGRMLSDEGGAGRVLSGIRVGYARLPLGLGGGH